MIELTLEEQDKLTMALCTANYDSGFSCWTPASVVVFKSGVVKVRPPSQKFRVWTRARNVAEGVMSELGYNYEEAMVDADNEHFWITWTIWGKE